LNIKQQGCDPVELAISVEENKAAGVRLGDNALTEALRNVLADRSIPKSVHDYKSALRMLFRFAAQTKSPGPTAAEPQPRAAVPQEKTELPLAGVRDDVMLFSYLLNPTYSSHTLPEVALRRFNLQLSGMTAEAADHRWGLAANACRSAERTRPYDLQRGSDRHRPAFVNKPESAKPSHSHRAWPRNSFGVHCGARQRTPRRRLFAD